MHGTVIHRGRAKTTSAQQRRWLKPRQAIEPVIGHLKADHGMQRCWLKGLDGDALDAVLCAAGFNIRWLMRHIARLGLRAFLLALIELARCAANRPSAGTAVLQRCRDAAQTLARRLTPPHRLLPAIGTSITQGRRLTKSSNNPDTIRQNFASLRQAELLADDPPAID